MLDRIDKLAENIVIALLSAGIFAVVRMIWCAWGKEASHRAVAVAKRRAIRMADLCVMGYRSWAHLVGLAVQKVRRPQSLQQPANDAAAARLGQKPEILTFAQSRALHRYWTLRPAIDAMYLIYQNRAAAAEAAGAFRVSTQSIDGAARSLRMLDAAAGSIGANIRQIEGVAGSIRANFRQMEVVAGSIRANFRQMERAAEGMGAFPVSIQSINRAAQSLRLLDTARRNALAPVSRIYGI